MNKNRKIPTFSIAFAAAVITMSAVSACGNGSKDYNESYTAEDWYSEQTDIYSGEIEEQPEETDRKSDDSPAIKQEETKKESDSMTILANDSAVSDRAERPAEPPRRHVRSKNLGDLAVLFNDSNHYQLIHAKRLGIEPITDLRSYYHTKRPLVKVSTNEDFRVDRLTHSYPYLVPEAEQLLHDIGRAFRDSVKARKGGDYRIIVTSLLRTPVTVKKLRKVNKNASELSTHQYATTFDIGYNNFDLAGGKDNANYGDLKLILAEVISNLHREGRCMVKYEKKSPCFHITVVR